MTDTSTEDELVEAEKVGLKAAQEYREECWCDCRSADRDWATKLAIRAARPLIAQQEREKVLREMLAFSKKDQGGEFVEWDFLKCYATEHGITLEEK